MLLSLLLVVVVVVAVDNDEVVMTWLSHPLLFVFVCIQSCLGYVAMTISVMHVLFVGWDSSFSPSAYTYCLPPVYLLAVVLPCVVLVGRLVLFLPFLAQPLARIRQGWESNKHLSLKAPEEESASWPSSEI